MLGTADTPGSSPGGYVRRNGAVFTLTDELEHGDSGELISPSEHHRPQESALKCLPACVQQGLRNQAGVQHCSSIAAAHGQPGGPPAPPHRRRCRRRPTQPPHPPLPGRPYSTWTWNTVTMTRCWTGSSMRQ